jgi:glucose-1-phosphate thymidylyltransferase
MKGIILAGGTGSRLGPITKSVSKQLLPVYDKPMIYYPISTLMLAGIREILIITTPQDQQHFVKLLGDGSGFGVNFQYAVQPEPKGLAQAFTIGEQFLSDDTCLMILGDNIFHGAGLGRDIINVVPETGAHVFTYKVSNPSEYGILEVDRDDRPISVTEKPKHHISNLAVTGLYFFDQEVVEVAKAVKPSPRGEVEITSIIDHYLKLNKLSYTSLSRGSVWLDTGNPSSLNDAAAYVRIVEERTGLKIACPEEIGYVNAWISPADYETRLNAMGNSKYSEYLRSIMK